MLDVYLALDGKITSNSLDVIGFRPKSIIFVGSSSTGTTVISTCRVLADMGLDLPENILLAFPSVSPNIAHVSPSRSLMALDHMISTTVFLTMFDAYAPDNVTDYRANRTPWFKRNREYVRSRIKQIDQKSKSDPYFDPFIGSFEIFNKTKLILIACELDPVLDDSIELAKKWPLGLVDFEVMPNVVHGFFHGFETDDTRKATQYTIEKLRNMVKLA